jgi:cell division protein FtsW
MKYSSRLDFVLLGLASILIIFGLVVLSSASSVISFEKWGDSFYLVKHQIFFGFIPGLLLFFLGLFTPYYFWRKTATPLLFFGLLLLVLVLIPGIGTSLGGSRSWLVWKGFSFQPSELIKIFLIFYLAAWLTKRGREASNFTYGFLPFLFLVGVTAFLIGLQPDVGTMFIILIIAFLVYFLAGASWRHLLFLFFLGALAFVFLVKLAPYRVNRLMVFLHPELDPKGIGYHINQAFLAIGSGGLFGLGYGQSRQKFRYLPEVSGDSIFAIMAEEFGFIISSVFILILFLFFYRMIKLAEEAPDVFARFTVLGIASWFIVQSLVNISSMVGLLPLTGLPLPFVSYGGTALAMEMFALGVVANISRYS